VDDQSNVLLRAAQPAVVVRTSGAATVSFAAAALSLIGLVLGPWVPGVAYAFLFFIPAIVAGHVARRAFRKCPGAYRNEGMATYGLAIGYFGLFLSIFVVSAMIFGQA
jgi:hypothetical protein